MNQPELFSGAELKMAGIESVTIHSAEWMLLAIQAIAVVAAAGEPFTVEDVRHYADENGIPAPHHHNAWGAAFHVSAAQGMIRRIGFGSNHSPAAHERIIGIWIKNETQ